MIEIRSDTLLLTETSTGVFETVSPIAAAGLRTYAIEQAQLDSGGNLKDNFYFKARTIYASDVSAKKASILSQISLSGSYYGSFVFYIGEREIEVVVSTGSGAAGIAAAINNAIVPLLGPDYAAFATVVSTDTGDRLFLEWPAAENSAFTIPSSPFANDTLGLPAGDYAGDIPYPFRSYAEGVDELFVLYDVTADGSFIPVIQENGILQTFVSEFDRNLIESNSRLKLFFDGFAYIMNRIHKEATRVGEQLDLAKIDVDNIQYLAYLFGINLDALVNLDGEISAREVLTSIMNIIQRKGTAVSFNVFYKFIGLDAEIFEYRPDLTQVDTEISQSDIQSFYQRFLVADSEFRSPLLNYGVWVASSADLPATGYEGEVIKVIGGGIWQYSVTDGWQEIYPSTDPIAGVGEEPDEEIASLGWTWTETNRPYNRIRWHDYNEIKADSGFALAVGNGTLFGPELYGTSAGNQSNATLVSDFVEPYNLSVHTTRYFKLRIDGTEYELDLSDYSATIVDYSEVYIETLKPIIERAMPVAVFNDAGKMVIRSLRSGTSSSIETVYGSPEPYSAYSGLGFKTGANYYTGIQTTTLRIGSGEASPVDGLAKPQVTFAGGDYEITSGGSAIDAGAFDIYVDATGDIIFSGDAYFDDSLYDPHYGYVSKVFAADEVAELGTITYKDGQIISAVPARIRSAYEVTAVLGLFQSTAIRAFMRSKLTVAGRTTATGYEGESEFGNSFYARDGGIGPSTDTPGMSNRVLLSTRPTQRDFLLTEEVTKQSIEFIKYIRPAHVRLLEVLFNVPEMKSVWPRVSHRPPDAGLGISMPGFWPEKLADRLELSDLDILAREEARDESWRGYELDILEFMSSATDLGAEGYGWTSPGDHLFGAGYETTSSNGLDKWFDFHAYTNRRFDSVKTRFNPTWVETPLNGTYPELPSFDDTGISTGTVVGNERSSAPGYDPLANEVDFKLSAGRNTITDFGQTPVLHWPSDSAANTIIDWAMDVAEPTRLDWWKYAKTLSLNDVSSDFGSKAQQRFDDLGGASSSGQINESSAFTFGSENYDDGASTTIPYAYNGTGLGSRNQGIRDAGLEIQAFLWNDITGIPWTTTKMKWVEETYQQASFPLPEVVNWFGGGAGTDFERAALYQDLSGTTNIRVNRSSWEAAIPLTQTSAGAISSHIAAVWYQYGILHAVYYDDTGSPVLRYWRDGSNVTSWSAPPGVLEIKAELSDKIYVAWRTSSSFGLCYDDVTLTSASSTPAISLDSDGDSVVIAVSDGADIVLHAEDKVSLPAVTGALSFTTLPQGFNSSIFAIDSDALGDIWIAYEDSGDLVITSTAMPASHTIVAAAPLTIDIQVDNLFRVIWYDGTDTKALSNETGTRRYIMGSEILGGSDPSTIITTNGSARFILR